MQKRDAGLLHPSRVHAITMRSYFQLTPQFLRDDFIRALQADGDWVDELSRRDPAPFNIARDPYHRVMPYAQNE